MSPEKQKALLKEYRKEIISLFRDISDINIRRYILGCSDDEDELRDAISDISQYVQYMKNVMSLSFYFAYACYRCDADSEESIAEQLSKHNAKRIINSLKYTFIKYPVTPDLIQFVLTDIQFELAQGSGSELKEMCRNLCSSEMSDFSFSPYLIIITEYDKNPSRFKYSQIELARLLKDLLEVMTFLTKYSLVCDGPGSFRFVSKSKGEHHGRAGRESKYDDMPVEHIFFMDNEKYIGGIYRLFSLERGEKIAAGKKQHTLCLKYLTPGEERSLSFLIPDDEEETPQHLCEREPAEVFAEITGQNGYDGNGAALKKNSNKIDLVHTVNYKYTKNLALAISDTISSNAGSKKCIYNHFSQQYPYIFERNPASKKYDQTYSDDEPAPYEDESLDWDSIVIMLLIEASPSVVLECLIRNNRQTFYNIAKNLYARFFNSEILEVLNQMEKPLRDEVYKIIDENLIVGEAEGFGKLPSKAKHEKLFSKAAAMLIISTLSKLQDTEQDENLIYTGNLHSNLDLLERISKESESEKKIRYSCIILGETLKHLICFYSGLFKYGIKKAEYDMLFYARASSKPEITKQQRELEGEFMSGAKAMLKDVDGYAMESGKSTEELMNMSIELMQKFITFCESCTLQNNSLSDRSKNLYYAVGKYEITNIRILKKQYNQMKGIVEKKPDQYDNLWIKTALDTLEFLKTGSFSDTAIDSDLFNAVYPFTAVFNRGKENSDGYKTVNFALNIDIDDDNISDYHADVNVLSEFSYSRNEVYYCLPNVLRSNSKWWIDPVMINFREFNNIFIERKDN